MIRRLLRGALIKAVDRRMRHSLHRLVQASLIYDQSVSSCEPGKSKVVVLAPHMDDEVLGCGGTIARHVAAGSEVTVVFLTDGRRGGAGVASPDNPAPGPLEIVGIRKAEARRAAQILGIRATVFLDAEDSRLSCDSQVSDRLREILENLCPDIVFLPFFLESHPDHRAANSVLFAAARGTALRFECWGYEVWTPLFPNRLVGIDATVHLKRQALGCYESQLAVLDYLHSGIGLNAYRALGLGSPARRYAEAFHALALPRYRRLYDAALR